jgi:PncC family amidohydrolase
LIIILFMNRQTLSISEMGDLLREKGLYLATAESCSGGLLGHLITNVAGSSDYYWGGFITYSNQAKERFLGVQSLTLREFGAVSRETVLEMARGARDAFKDVQPLDKLIGLSTSGIAGPGGGSAEKPVGTVWVGFSSADGDQAQLFHFSGAREEIKQQTALKALEMLKGYLRR